MNEFEKFPQPTDKWADFQKGYNKASKNIVQLLGTNITLFICMLLPLLLIGFIWTDFGIILEGPRFISDGIVTVLTLVIGEMMMMRVGADGGKLDVDYQNTRTEYHGLVEEIHKLGTSLLPIFCEWQIDLEMKQAFNSRLRALRYTEEELEKVRDLSWKELKKRFGLKKARRINAIRKLEPIELSEAILLYENDADAINRGGIPISGDGYIHKKSYYVEVILSSLFMGLLTVSIAFSLTTDITFARVMYTIFKVVVLLFRMARGYERGARAYHTIETRQLQAKSHFLRLYKSFVDDKTYNKLGDKYGDITALISEKEIPLTNE